MNSYHRIDYLRIFEKKFNIIIYLFSAMCMHFELNSNLNLANFFAEKSVTKSKLKEKVGI